MRRATGSPTIPATTPPPFEVADGARVVAVGELADLVTAPAAFVVVGSGKTATDGIVWLLTNGVAPDRITWVRPRDPWMLNRAVVQPDPAVFLGMGADVWEAAARASSLDDLYLRLEDAGVMLRIDTSLTPTMSRAPTIAQWEIDLLRTVEDVVRLGHVLAVERGRMTLAGGERRIADDALVVHCAAAGLPMPPMVPIWRREVITLQTSRAGFPCFAAALDGYVEATRSDDAEKNRLCPPNHYGDTLADWMDMNVLGARATAQFAAEPDIREWADTVALYPARIPPGHPGSDALDRARARLAEHAVELVDRFPLPSRFEVGPGADERRPRFRQRRRNVGRPFGERQVAEKQIARIPGLRLLLEEIEHLRLSRPGFRGPRPAPCRASAGAPARASSRRAPPGLRRPPA